MRETEQLFFVIEQFVARNFRRVADQLEFDSIVDLFHLPEQADKSGLLGHALAFAELHGAFDRVQQQMAFGAGAVAQTVHRPGLDERFECALTHRARIDAGAEIAEGCEGAALSPRAQDLLDGSLADPLDGQQTEADAAVLDREALLRGVDIGTVDQDTHACAFDDSVRSLFGVIGHRRHRRGMNSAV